MVHSCYEFPTVFEVVLHPSTSVRNLWTKPKTMNSLRKELNCAHAPSIACGKIPNHISLSFPDQTKHKLGINSEHFSEMINEK